MKKMTCKQLGGACDTVFHANTFEEIAEMSKQHALKMFQQGDPAHINAMGKMRGLMQSPEDMQQWMDGRRKEFESLPEED